MTLLVVRAVVGDRATSAPGGQHERHLEVVAGRPGVDDARTADGVAHLERRRPGRAGVGSGSLVEVAVGVGTSSAGRSRRWRGSSDRPRPPARLDRRLEGERRIDGSSTDACSAGAPRQETSSTSVSSGASFAGSCSSTTVVVVSSTGSSSAEAIAAGVITPTARRQLSAAPTGAAFQGRRTWWSGFLSGGRRGAGYRHSRTRRPAPQRQVPSNVRPRRLGTFPGHRPGGAGPGRLRGVTAEPTRGRSAAARTPQGEREAADHDETERERGSRHDQVGAGGGETRRAGGPVPPPPAPVPGSLAEAASTMYSTTRSVRCPRRRWRRCAARASPAHRSAGCRRHRRCPRTRRSPIRSRRSCSRPRRSRLRRSGRSAGSRAVPRATSRSPRGRRSRRAARGADLRCGCPPRPLPSTSSV